MRNENINELEKKMGYSFKNKEYLTEALTHSSYANELKTKKKYARCNERLEFLGDSILSIITSEYLFGRYPDLPEGELTKIRAALVQSQTLSLYAKKIDLGAFLYLGHGEELGGGRERQSILENAFEALLAAIYLDSSENFGLAETKRFLLRFIEEELNSDNISVVHFDSKTELQQLIQQSEGDFLEYVVVAESGPDHDKVFEVEAKLNSNVIGRGSGKSKREAEQNAAKKALELFGY